MKRLWWLVPMLLLSVAAIVSAQETSTPITTNNAAQLTLTASWQLSEDSCVQFSHDWHTMLVNDGSQLQFYDLTRPAQESQVLAGEYPCTIQFAPDGETLLMVEGQVVSLLDAATGAVLQTFAEHTEAVISAAISPDSRYLATSQRYGIRLFDVATGALLQHYTQEENGNLVYGGVVFFSPDSMHLVAATQGTTHVWDVATGSWASKFASSMTDASAFYSPDGTKLLVYSNLSANFRLLDTVNGSELQTGTYRASGPIAFSPDSQFLAVSSFDRSLTLYNAQDGSPHLALQHESVAFAFNPDASILATLGDDLYLWDTATNFLLATYTIPDDVQDVVFAGNGGEIFTAAPNGVQLWQVDPTATSGTVRCPGFMESRLRASDQARVLPGLPNNLRAEARADADEIGEIPSGDSMMVIRGPICADNLTWWQVDYGGLVGWTAEGYENEYWLEPIG
jgi:WD40 repeat protein